MGYTDVDDCLNRLYDECLVENAEMGVPGRIVCDVCQKIGEVSDFEDLVERNKAQVGSALSAESRWGRFVGESTAG
jgi:hypothetical protein